jgi:hypothetical protein
MMPVARECGLERCGTSAPDHNPGEVSAAPKLQQVRHLRAAKDLHHVSGSCSVSRSTRLTGIRHVVCAVLSPDPARPRESVYRVEEIIIVFMFPSSLRIVFSALSVARTCKTQLAPHIPSRSSQRSLLSLPSSAVKAQTAFHLNSTEARSVCPFCEADRLRLPVGAISCCCPLTLHVAQLIWLVTLHTSPSRALRGSRAPNRANQSGISCNSRPLCAGANWQTHDSG